MVDFSLRSVKWETVVFDFKGQRIFLIFRLSTNLIDHNDETGHFVKHSFLVLIFKVNVKREILFCSNVNKGELGMAHPVRWGWEFLVQPHCSKLFALVKASKKGFPNTREIKSRPRICWPMGIWLLIVSYWTTNQKPSLVQILIYENRMIKRIIREDEKRDQEETQDCQRSIPSILDLRHPKQLSDFTKLLSPRLKRY